MLQDTSAIKDLFGIIVGVGVLQIGVGVLYIEIKMCIWFMCELEMNYNIETVNSSRGP